MSKAAKQSIFILIILLSAGLGFAGFTLLEKQKIEEQKVSLERELQASRDREKKNLGELKTMEDQLELVQGEKTKFEQAIADLEKKVEDLLTQIGAITAERDKWQQRLDEIKKERDELVVKLKEKPQVIYEEKIVYKEREPASTFATGETPVEEVSAPAIVVPSSGQAPSSLESTSHTGATPTEATAQAKASEENELAQLLRQKASLEVEIERLKNDMSQRSIEIVGLKQENESLRMDLEAVRHDKEQIEDAIVAKEEMIDNLSLELARAKNDKRFVARKADKLSQQNMALRQEIKKLSAAKKTLERSMVRITRRKDEMEKKLEQTETVVQNKIDEIWEIKDSLDRSFQAVKSAKKPSEGEVELPPIVVNNQNYAPTAAPSARFDAGITKPGFEGKVLSVNVENNFVIVDIGGKRGLRAGDTLGVYRDSEYIARLEVIQVRPDIAAADLKDQWSKVRAGDTVR